MKTGNDIITVIESAEDYTESFMNQEIVVDGKKPLYRRLAHAALNTAINGFYTVIKFKLDKQEESGEAHLDAAADLDDSQKATEMEQANGQETYIQRIHTEAVLAAKLYNTLANDMKDEENQFNRPMSVKDMVGFRAMNERPADEIFLKTKADALGITMEHARLLARVDALTNLGDFRHHAPEIIKVIESMGILDEMPEFPPMMQLQWANKLIDKSLEDADKRISKTSRRDQLQRAMVAKQYTLNECKKLQELGNDLLRDNAELFMELDIRGVNIPVLDIKQKESEAVARVLAQAERHIKQLETSLGVTQAA